MKIALCLAVCLCAGSVLAQPEGVEIGVLPGPNLYGTFGTVRFRSEREILLTGFSYDGRAPAAYFYVYPPGVQENRNGNGGSLLGNRLVRRYSNEDVIIDLPSGKTVCDIGTFSVWCRAGRITFTAVVIPALTASYDRNGNCVVEGLVNTGGAPPVDEENCIPLHENFQLSWTLLPESNEARFTLCGCQSLVPGVNRYLGFGLSGSPAGTSMFGADPVITWVDQMTMQPNAVDYFLSDYVQCRDGVGACPDSLIAGGQCSDNVRDISGSTLNGFQCITFTRSFDGSDECDKSFTMGANTDNFVVWAFGELGETAFRHSSFSRATSTDTAIRFGREPRNDCQGPPTCSSCPPFNPNQIVARDDTSFLAEIGPSASDRGYVAATGQAGWGIAWYIDGELAPELVVERGKTYTFTIYGGNVENNPSEYHPFYISDSLMGGRLLFSAEQQAGEVVYAGFDSMGTTATAAGALCQYMETDRSRDLLENCGSYSDYVKSLESRCNAGDPATLVFTPTESTPDILYYQCAFHLSLGWRIRVLNEGDPVPTLATFVPLGAPSLAFFRLPAITISFLSLLALALA